MVLSCAGCTAVSPGDDQEGGADSLVKKQVVTSREQAREVMGDYLQKKYGAAYEVQLPRRNDSGNFQAQAYPGGNVNYGLYIMVDTETGECRDSGCLDLVEAYVEEQLNEIQQESWEKSHLQILCDFRENVPEQEWAADADAEDIIEEEQIQCQIFLMVSDTEPVRNQEAEKLQKILNADCLNGMQLTLEGYYVNSETFSESESQLSDGRDMMLADCGRNYTDKVTVRWNPEKGVINPEEIISGFNR